VRTVDGLCDEVPDAARALMAAFWPGALTVVCRAQPSLAWDLGETRGTVAVRMPDHPAALAVLRRTGPLAVSSANRTGRPAALTAAGLVGVGLPPVVLTIVLGLLAVASAVTVVQRMVVVRRQAVRAAES